MKCKREQAVVLSIGDELMMGQLADTNAAWISARLAEAGIMTRYHQALPDETGAIAAAFRQASRSARLVVATGGLGPTADDLTRQALAAALGTRLRLHAPSRTRIARFFRDRGRRMTPANLVQAMLPCTAAALDNPVGTAPGMTACLGRASVFALPGVPREMRVMFDRHVWPRLAGISSRLILAAQVNTFGLGESQVGEMLGDLMLRDRNPRVGTNVADGVVTVKIRAECGCAADKPALDDTLARVHARLGNAVFGLGTTTLAGAAGDLLRRTGHTLATAESCTGGMLGAMLTDIPGASAWYRGGWVLYADEMKHRQLGVPLAMLRREGAVSEAVARHMALKVLRRAAADCALAVTGIAGPGGGTPAKPVGTVWIALGMRRGVRARLWSERCFFPGDRAMARRRAALSALNMLRLRLLNDMLANMPVETE